MNYEVKGSYGQSQMGAVALQQGNPINKVPQIGNQIDILEKELACQRDVLEGLKSKLSPVLSLGPDKNTIGIDGPPEPTCPMASILQRAGLVVANNNAILNDILSRLEV